jgi:hypothetical protein
MKLIKYTYVDIGTNVSVLKEPAFNGVEFPQIKGLKFLFALERKYPTQSPEFIGECDDDADITSEGIIKEIDQQELQLEQSEEFNAQANRIRAQRNMMLSSCDWTQVADAQVNKTAWAAYRQSLRDVPEQQGFPWSVQWPSAPQ